MTKITGAFHEDQYTFFIISRSFLLRMRNASDKSCAESQNTHEPFLLPTDAHNVKNAELLKHSKLDKNAPTCFGLHRNHLQGAKVSAWLKITVYSIPSHSARYTRLTGHNMQP